MFDVLVVGVDKKRINETVRELSNRGVSATGINFRYLNKGVDGLRFRKVIVAGDATIDNNILKQLNYLNDIQAKFQKIDIESKLIADIKELNLSGDSEIKAKTIFLGEEAYETRITIKH